MRSRGEDAGKEPIERTRQIRNARANVGKCGSLYTWDFYPSQSPTIGWQRLGGKEGKEEPFPFDSKSTLIFAQL